MVDFLETSGDAWIEEAGGTVDEVEQGEADAVIEAVAEPEEVEEKPDAEAAAGEPDKPVHTVPYAEMKREREKRQEAERKLQELQSPQQPQARPRLDAYEDPDRFQAHFDSGLDQAKWEMRAEISGLRAEQAHGKETVEAAVAWAVERGASDPALGVKVQNSADPVGLLVNEYKQSRTLEALAGRSFEEAAQDYAKQQGWIVSPGETPSTKQSPRTPPRSLASRPGQGGSNQGGGDPFDGVFASGKMGLR